MRPHGEEAVSEGLIPGRPCVHTQREAHLRHESPCIAERAVGHLAEGACRHPHKERVSERQARVKTMEVGPELVVADAACAVVAQPSLRLAALCPEAAACHELQREGLRWCQTRFPPQDPAQRLPVDPALVFALHCAAVPTSFNAQPPHHLFVNGDPGLLLHDADDLERGGLRAGRLHVPMP